LALTVGMALVPMSSTPWWSGGQSALASSQHCQEMIRQVFRAYAAQ
jgi:hypothetical protein